MVSSLLGAASPIGLALGAAGAAMSAIGAYQAVQAQQFQLGSQASNLDFQGTMADFNARLAERDAHDAIEAGRHQKGLSTLRFGQIKSSSRTRLAASGVQAGVGSAAEVQTSIEAAKEIDSLTIERSAVRAAGSARLRAVDSRNRASFARVSAGNLRRQAGALSPGLAALTSLIGGAGQVTSSFLFQQSLLQNMG